MRDAAGNLSNIDLANGDGRRPFNCGLACFIFLLTCLFFLGFYTLIASAETVIPYPNSNRSMDMAPFTSIVAFSDYEMMQNLSTSNNAGYADF